jgi:predicted nuclease with TOPRIM domain
MTITTTSAASLSGEELSTVVRHLLERTADLEAKLHRAHTDLATVDALNASYEQELRRKDSRISTLSARCEELEQRCDQPQQGAAEPKPPGWSVFGRRIGNSR